MSEHTKVPYMARTQTGGGRHHGMARNSDGQLNIRLATPGSARIGTNPEQLFADGWSACFESAISLVTQKKRVVLAAEVAIDAEIDLDLSDDGFSLTACLNASIPGVGRDVAQMLVDEAHQILPYSKATRGNIDVSIKLM